MIGIHQGVVSKEFIERRDIMAPVFNAGIFGADAEFPEHHQSEIDSMQELNETYHYDTYHSGLSASLDYKMHSQKGVHISTSIQKCIKEDVLDKLVIWRWIPFYTELKEGMRVKYEILAIVDAKEALNQLNEENRFTFPL